MEPTGRNDGGRPAHLYCGSRAAWTEARTKSHCLPRCRHRPHRPTHGELTRMRVLAIALALLLNVSRGVGQGAIVQTFEVASIRPYAGGDAGPVGASFKIEGDRFV